MKRMVLSENLEVQVTVSPKIMPFVDSETDGDGLGVFIILAGPEVSPVPGREPETLREKSPGSGDEGRACRKKKREGVKTPFSSVVFLETEGRVVVHLLFEEGDIAHDTGAVLE